MVVTMDPQVAASELIPRFGGPHPVGGPATTGQRESASSALGTLDERTGNAYDQFKRHARNFLDCLRSRRDPISDLESGHRVATACHLANLSLRLGRKLRWDADRETVLADPEAAALLERPYRAPWDAERNAVLGRG
jgi:hypothetical protein